MKPTEPTVEELKREIKNLRSQLISGFYEEEFPQFRQGEPQHELESLVTAKEVNGLIKMIRAYKKVLGMNAHYLRTLFAERTGLTLVDRFYIFNGVLEILRAQVEKEIGG